MYDYWIDAEGFPHEIAKMDTQYIMNCLKSLNNMLSLWRGITPDRLTNEELKLQSTVGMKAWFVFHGIAYIDAMCAELDRRKGENNG